MPTPGLGHKSYVQIIKEAAYGTALAATAKFECISFDIAPIIGTIEDASLYNQQSRRALYQGGLLYRGTIVVRLNYEGLIRLFEGVFGSAVKSGPTESVVYTYTCKEAAALPSYTIELIEGDIPATKCQQVVGAKFTSITVRGSAGQGNEGMLTAEIGVLAKDKVSNVTPASLSFPAIFPVLFHQAITADEGSDSAAADIRVRSFEVTLENALAEDRFYFTSVNIEEPVRDNFLEARFRIEQEFVNITLFNRARAFTTANLQFVFRHPDLIVGASTLKREFELRSGSAVLENYSNPVEGYGIIIARSTWRAFYDPTDLSALVARLQNKENITV